MARYKLTNNNPINNCICKEIGKSGKYFISETYELEVKELLCNIGLKNYF